MKMDFLQECTNKSKKALPNNVLTSLSNEICKRTKG